jgi:hypothetical protein
MSYVKIKIGEAVVEVTSHDELPVSLNYSLEDPGNFQVKDSSNSLGLKIPATLVNDAVANTFRNPDVMDMTPDETFKGNRPCSIEANGYEILNGKAFLVGGSHGKTPTDYQFNLYGDNADWVIDMDEKTLFDFLKNLTFAFTKTNIQNSWVFDGMSEALPYVFAPVRYRSPMGGYTTQNINGVLENVGIDTNVKPEYMRPAISIYWLLYWGFKSVGYKIVSDFFNTPYFRRLVMPWTWGNFLDSDGTKLNVHKFLAKGTGPKSHSNANGGNYSGYMDLDVSNDSVNPAYDNNGDYVYDTPTKECRWTYNAPHFGLLTALFSATIEYKVHGNNNSDAKLVCRWFKNTTAGSPLQEDVIFNFSAPGIGQANDQGLKEIFFDQPVAPGDVIIAKFFIISFGSKLGGVLVSAEVVQLKLDGFRLQLGSSISFDNYTSFQNYKWMDYFKGVIDLFNLSVNTDASTKTVTIEPTHPYMLEDDPSIMHNGYFKDDFVEWDGKEDLSKEWTPQNFSDYEREVFFKFKDDGGDGILKIIQDRNVTKVAQSKYVLTNRFKQGKKEVENRFFAPTMHYEADQFKALGTGSNVGISPQFICIIPENVSNTSNSESSNTFLPKIAFYKGSITGVGAWKWDGTTLQNFPFMFAVNYKVGGKDDPILSYSDERIKGTSGDVVGKGLLTRFFVQRMAIIRNGQWYNVWMRLVSSDVANQIHREFKSFRGQRWELVQIKDYKPLLPDSTSCLIRRWVPVEQRDADNIFPSNDNVLGNNPVPDPFDIKYVALKCLVSDVPN